MAVFQNRSQSGQDKEIKLEFVFVVFSKCS